MNKLTEQQKKYLSEIIRVLVKHGTPMIATMSIAAMGIAFQHEWNMDEKEIQTFIAEEEYKFIKQFHDQSKQDKKPSEEHYKS